MMDNCRRTRNELLSVFCRASLPTSGACSRPVRRRFALGVERSDRGGGGAKTKAVPWASMRYSEIFFNQRRFVCSIYRKLI
jgi:hypothetical protein